MNNEEYNFNLRVLMEAGHPKREAEKHLKDGAIVFYDLEEHFDDYMKEFFHDFDEETRSRKSLNFAGW